ncbi:MAG TPA: dinitrogenase iron-molybdenum cofactor biosynthesis protein [Firmicutes bacterium]|nr:dinitrogenase iron-molybdenum cofactor biosynthesis protein [Bacillota bacterium]
MSKVAVASTDGVSINEHFGRAQEFLIYEVGENGTYSLLEHRANNAACVHDAGDQAAGTTTQLLTDVEAVLVSQIGPRAERELKRYGVFAFAVPGPIDKALKAYGKRGKLIRSTVSKGDAGCQPCGSNRSCGCS